MNILFIGFKNPDHEAMFRSNAFKALGHNVRHLDPWDSYAKDFLKLSDVYEGEDFVFISALNSKILTTDLPKDIPIVYYHSELLWRPSVDKCNILLMAHPAMENVFVYWFPELIRANPAKYIQHYAVDLKRFDYGKRKKYLKCTFTGPSEWKEKMWIERDMYKKRDEILEEVRELVDVFPTQEYENYINILKHSQATFIVHGRCCYISQRIFEAAAANCCPIIFVDDEIGLKIYEDIGLIDGYNCLFVYGKSTVKEELFYLLMNNDWRELERIGKNARAWVEKRDSINKSKDVIKYVEKYKKWFKESSEQRSLRATRIIESELRIDIQDQH